MSKTNAKVALITGASRGAPAEALVCEIQAQAGTAHLAQADVSVATQGRGLFEHVQSELGGVDVLVNNAGVMPLAPIAEMDDEVFERVLNINLKGAFYAMREAAKLAKELRGRNITVNAVAPGPTATQLFFEGKSQETVDRIARLSPLQRLGKPSDIASVVAFLAGPDGAWVNGQIVRANGGII